MSKNWTADHALVDSIATNLCEAAVMLPRQLLRIDELVHTFGMPFSHIQIMVMLSGGAKSISRISAVLGIAKPNITPLLDNLGGRGLVERIRDEQDRRIVNVHLTQAGWDMIAELRKTVASQVMMWAERFSKSDVKRLNTALATMLSLVDGGGSEQAE